MFTIIIITEYGWPSEDYVHQHHIHRIETMPPDIQYFILKNASRYGAPAAAYGAPSYAAETGYN